MAINDSINRARISTYVSVGGIGMDRRYVHVLIVLFMPF